MHVSCFSCFVLNRGICVFLQPPAARDHAGGAGWRRRALGRLDREPGARLGFAFCRYVLELPTVTAMGREAVVASLGPTLQRYLAEASL